MINWNHIVDNLVQEPGSAITTDPSRWNLKTPGYEEIYKIWRDANFNAAAIKWINYYPGTHFDEEVVKEASSLLNLTGVHRSWISRIDPGYMAPWHWDVDDNERTYLEKGAITRYTIIARDFIPGQMFILKDKHFYDLKQNAIIKWDHHRDWHSGINGSMSPNWMFHILGY
jgi:hypothetical protein